jgi:hypothetical protein
VIFIVERLDGVAHFCAFRKSGAFSERGCHAIIFALVESRSRGCRTLRLFVQGWGFWDELSEQKQLGWLDDVVGSFDRVGLVTFRRPRLRKKGPSNFARLSDVISDARYPQIAMILLDSLDAVERILYIIVYRFNEQWQNHTLRLFTQAA